MELVVATIAGLEDIAAEEIEQLAGLGGGRIAAPGRLVLSLPDEARRRVVELNGSLRCADRIGIALGESGCDLGEILETVAAADLAAWIDPRRSFAIRASRVGVHDYRSPELAAAVGRVVIDRLRAVTGVRAPVDLSRPETVLRAEVDGDGFLFWLDTTGDVALHRRAYRCYAHMASLRASAAALLLRCSGWRDETLIDPLCGSATILIEAGLEALGVTPSLARGEPWAWQRLPAFATLEPAAAPRAPRLERADLRLVGVERFLRHLRGGIDNAAAAGLGDLIRFHGGLAERLADLLPARARDAHPRVVVTNPPFGRRVSAPAQVAALYRRAAVGWARADVRRVTTWTELDEAMSEALATAGFEPVVRRSVRYGAIPVTLFVADRCASI